MCFKKRANKYSQTKGQNERLSKDQILRAIQKEKEYREELGRTLGRKDLYEVMDDWTDEELYVNSQCTNKTFRDLVSVYREITTR